MLSPFTILARDTNSRARTGVLYTKHGVVHTPVFMPVATQGCVKALTDQDLQNAGAECLLSNTYHLSLRPGTPLLKQMGGLHRFMHWNGSILTDSGGVQEEAPTLGVPVLVLRDETERPEALQYGGVKLVGTNKEKIIKTVQELLDNKEEYDRMSKAVNPYGDGKACEYIEKIILNHFGM